MIRMFDTVTPAAIGRLASTSPDAVAGYVDGRYRDLTQLENAYPGHHHMGIAVTARDDAECLDIETGDATPWDAPGWVRRQHARGVARPCLYANESTMPTVKVVLQRAGIERQAVRLWMAHYNGVTDVPAGFDAHQYTDHWEGRNVDASMCLDDFFSLPAPHPGKAAAPARRHPVRRAAARAKPHRKVVAAGTGGGLGIAILHILAGAGVTVTPTEAAGISTAVAILAGWLAPPQP